MRLSTFPAPRLKPAVLLCFAALLAPALAFSQVNYVVRFEMDKGHFLAGEPVFCRFIIRNTGARSFAFSYRPPSRVHERGLDGEPRFIVKDAAGKLLADPAPETCGGAIGTVVYGSVTLPPGQSHTERWLLDQWANFSLPGSYHLRAERRLPLRETATSERPTAFAMAIADLSFAIEPSTESQLRAAFAPYLAALTDRAAAAPVEAEMVVATLPRPFMIDALRSMANAPSSERWDRRQALEGLARLGTPEAWRAILAVAQGNARTADNNDSLRAYAALLLAERGDKAFLPVFTRIVATAKPDLRGAVLRTLGFFHDARASQILFERLHSPVATDRMNAILGLKNLGSKDSIPALLAMLNDPEAQVRQVANFALERLTAHNIPLTAGATPEESSRVADQWHVWWRKNASNLSPPRQAACRDW